MWNGAEFGGEEHSHVRIAISLLNYRPGQIGGAETYITHFLAALPEVKADDEIVLVGYRHNAGALEIPGLERHIIDKGDNAIILARCLEAFTPYRARFAERAFREVAPDVVYFPQQSIFPKRVAFPSVVQVVDIQHLFFPQYFSLFDRAFRAAIYPYSLRCARRIFSISHCTKQTLVARCGVAADKVTPIPFGFSPMDTSAVATEEAIEGPYLYYPAAAFPHKGHAVLLRTFAALRQAGNFDFKLVLTGKQTPLWRQLARLARELDIERHVVHLGFVPYARVQQLYQGAAAVLFPTEFEGFGLPVLEAVQFGKKIVCSRLEIFDELGVPREFQIDFSDAAQLRNALAIPGATVLEKNPWTWQEAAQTTLEKLRAVISEQKRTED